MKKLKRIFWFGVIAGLLFLIFSNAWVIFSTKKYVFQSLALVPKAEVALVLGTSKSLVNGEENPYFNFRMEAAAQLYKSGKVKHLILSGDNKTRYYNEPKYMREALVKMGVPEKALTLDYAGFRTLDSVVRCKKIFGQTRFIIVTQRFHTYRAVFIGKHFGVEATAFAAENIPLRQSFTVIFREFLARPKAVLDLYLLDVDPKFMGEKEDVNVI